MEFKNYYFNRDYLDDDGQSRQAEWAQGFLLRLDSGFIGETVGVGVDAIAMYGLKLDSSPGRSGTGLLEREAQAPPGEPGHARRAKDDYAKYGVTAKLRFAESELRHGYLEPRLPSLRPNTSRLFPQSFLGTQLVSNDIDGLELTIGQLTRTRQRDSTGHEPFGLTGKGGAYRGAASSQRFQFVGADYRFSRRTGIGYHYAQLEDIYRQHYVGLNHAFELGAGRMGMDLRYFAADEHGSADAGRVDNRALSTRLSYRWNGHAVSGGYQSQFGDTPFPYLRGTNVYLFSQHQLSNFTETGERVWHASYGYDFSRLGVPGLTFTGRYAYGDKATVRGYDGEARERELDLDLEYVLQSGPLKGLSLRWRSAMRRANFTRDVDENRLMIGYTIPL